MDQRRRCSHWVRGIRPHALDGNRAKKTVRAADDAQEHLGATTGPDLVPDLVPFEPRCIESRWYRLEEHDGRVEHVGHLLRDDGADLAEAKREIGGHVATARA